MQKIINLTTIPEIKEEANQGKMFILIDDENRENEGDLVMPAQKCTAQHINFMATFGRGLICLALTPKRVKQLELSLMSSNNQSKNKTAFTVSIEAKEGISTGISAYDRAKTIEVAIDSALGKESLVSPGHIFPLQAEEGGVLVLAEVFRGERCAGIIGAHLKNAAPVVEHDRVSRGAQTELPPVFDPDETGAVDLHGPGESVEAVGEGQRAEPCLVQGAPGDERDFSFETTSHEFLQLKTSRGR